MKITNLKIFNFGNYHILIWKNIFPEFKFLKINNRMYKKYSVYIGPFIFEVGKLKYGTKNKSVSTINK